MYSKHTKGKLMGLIVACSALCMGQTANATVVGAQSNGYGLNIDLGVLDLPVSIGPFPAAAHGTAPSPYDVAEDGLALDLLLLKVNALSGAASSDVDGLAGNKTTDAFGELAGLSLNVLGLISLDVGIINANASVTGDYGSMVAAGDSTITALSGSILGHDFGLNVDPSGNIGLLGVTVALNEELTSCSDDYCYMETNALHINFDDFALNPLLSALLGVKTLSGDIIIGHAFAEMFAQDTQPGPVVPIPAAAWLFGSGLMGLVGFARRRQSQVLA